MHNKYATRWQEREDCKRAKPEGYKKGKKNILPTYPLWYLNIWWDNSKTMCADRHQNGQKIKKRFLIYISMTQTYWLKCTAQCTWYTVQSLCPYYQDKYDACKYINISNILWMIFVANSKWNCDCAEIIWAWNKTKHINKPTTKCTMQWVMELPHTKNKEEFLSGALDPCHN